MGRGGLRPSPCRIALATPVLADRDLPLGQVDCTVEFFVRQDGGQEPITEIGVVTWYAADDEGPYAHDAALFGRIALAPDLYADLLRRRRDGQSLPEEPEIELRGVPVEAVGGRATLRANEGETPASLNFKIEGVGNSFRGHAQQ